MVVQLCVKLQNEGMSALFTGPHKQHRLLTEEQKPNLNAKPVCMREMCLYEHWLKKEKEKKRKIMAEMTVCFNELTDVSVCLLL